MASDAEIIRRVLAGDTNAFEALLIKYQGYVLRLIGRHAPPDCVVELAQEAFIRAFQSLKTIRRKESFKFWLSSVAHRTCYDFWRKRYRSPEVTFSHLSEEQTHRLNRKIREISEEKWVNRKKQKDATELLDWLLGKLKPADRMVMELIYLEGRTVKETAELLGWSTANVKVRTFRIRQKLKRMVSK